MAKFFHIQSSSARTKLFLSNVGVTREKACQQDYEVVVNDKLLYISNNNNNKLATINNSMLSWQCGLHACYDEMLNIRKILHVSLTLEKEQGDYEVVL